MRDQVEQHRRDQKRHPAEQNELLGRMKKGRVITATVFADEMGVSYPTVVRWLKRKLVPGAVLRESPDRGKWWEIPEEALTMERPKTGPKTNADAKPAKKARKRSGQ